MHIAVMKLLYFSKFYYHESFQRPTLNGVSTATASQVRVSAMLLLLIGGN
jgi:hypothetical protein